MNLNKASSSNEKRKIYRRENYENTHLDVGAGAICTAWLRRRNTSASDEDDHNDNDSRGDHWGSDRPSRYSRSYRAAGPTDGARGSANRCAGSRLPMDAGLLALEWRDLRLGVWRLGQTAPYHGCLGPWTLGAPRRRLDLHRWSLAINAASRQIGFASCRAERVLAARCVIHLPRKTAVSFGSGRES